MKQLPISLKNLILDLQENDSGENSENLKWLGEGIKLFPSSLESLKLNLNNYNLGDKNFKYLAEGIK